MTDVFISYSQKDRAIAKNLAEKLTGKGLTVWWDTELVGGEKFREAPSKSDSKLHRPNRNPENLGRPSPTPPSGPSRNRT